MEDTIFILYIIFVICFCILNYYPRGNRWIKSILADEQMWQEIKKKYNSGGINARD